MLKTNFNAKNAPEAIGPYCHAVMVGKMIFTSGQLGINPETGKLAEGVEAQAIQALGGGGLRARLPCQDDCFR